MPGLGETRQREAAFRLWLRQMLQLITENNSELKNNEVVSLVVFLAMPGQGRPDLSTVTRQKLNVGLDNKMLHWNIRTVLQIYLSRKVSMDSL